MTISAGKPSIKAVACGTSPFWPAVSINRTGQPKPRKVRALAQLRNAQLHGPGPGLPVAIAVAVALRQPVGRALAMAGPGQALDVQLHQPLRRKADHLAKERRVRALFQKLAKRDLVDGHRGALLVRVACATQPYRRTPR